MHIYVTFYFWLLIFSITRTRDVTCLTSPFSCCADTDNCTYISHFTFGFLCFQVTRTWHFHAWRHYSPVTTLDNYWWSYIYVAFHIVNFFRLYASCHMPDDKILLFKKPQMYLPAYNLAPKSHIMNMVGKTRSQELEHNTLLLYIAATDYHFYVKLQLSQLFLKWQDTVTSHVWHLPTFNFN